MKCSAITFLLRSCSFLAAMFIAGCGSVSTIQNPSTSDLGKGYEYRLPRTVFVIGIPLIRSEVKHGELAPFAEPLLLRPIPDEKDASFQLGGGTVSITPEGERDPDPDARILLQIKRNPFVTRAHAMEWSGDGVLVKGSASMENRTVEVIVNAVKEAADIAAAGVARLAVGGADGYAPTPRPGMRKLLEHLRKDNENPAARGMDIETLGIGLDILTSPNPAGIRSVIKPGTAAAPTDEQKKDREKLMQWDKYLDGGGQTVSRLVRAARAAMELGALQSALSSESSDAAAGRMEARAKALLGDFYTESDTSSTVSFRWVPEGRAAGVTSGSFCIRQPLLTLSPSRGIVAYHGIRPVQPSPFYSGKADGAGELTMVTAKLTGRIPDEAAGWDEVRSRWGGKGWRYRVPAKATLDVIEGRKRLVSSSVRVAQQGCIAFLPAMTGGAKMKAELALDPITGGLVTSSLDSSSFNPDLINRLGEAGAKAAAIDPELAKLKRQKEYFETIKAIKAAGGTVP